MNPFLTSIESIFFIGDELKCSVVLKFQISEKKGTMKPHLLIVTLTCLVLMETVQYVFGAAVMSVDLGSEWIKVRKNQ